MGEEWPSPPADAEGPVRGNSDVGEVRDMTVGDRAAYGGGGDDASDSREVREGSKASLREILKHSGHLR